ncbi:MAG: hypothetical protein AAGF87_06495 [Bacteroidota bacterium]
MLPNDHARTAFYRPGRLDNGYDHRKSSDTIRDHNPYKSVYGQPEQAFDIGALSGSDRSLVCKAYS